MIPQLMPANDRRWFGGGTQLPRYTPVVSHVNGGACRAGLEVAVPAVSVSRGRLVSSMAAPRVTRYAVGVAATLAALLLLHSADKHLQLRFR